MELANTHEPKSASAMASFFISHLILSNDFCSENALVPSRVPSTAVHQGPPTSGQAQLRSRHRLLEPAGHYARSRRQMANREQIVEREKKQSPLSDREM